MNELDAIKADIVTTAAKLAPAETALNDAEKEAEYFVDRSR